MILYDPAFNTPFRDYGIMLPISPDRAGRIIGYLKEFFVAGTRGSTMPYPGPVLSFAEALNYLGESGPADKVISRADLERAHSKEFIAALYNTAPSGGAGLSPLEKALLAAYELIDENGLPHRYQPELAVKPLKAMRENCVAQCTGSYLACRLALAPGPGFCFSLGGGSHHARYDRGSGFCLLNDAAVSAFKIIAEGRAKSVWIIDLDAHKGDGTAELARFARERGDLPEAALKTLSMHMASGWPLDEESLAKAEAGRAPLIPSDIDIGIEAGEEADYAPKLKEGVARLEKLSAATGRPDLILVVDGADPYEHDGLPSSGLLKLSLEQCLERDNFVYHYATERNIPSAWILAGGYGERAWEPPAVFLGQVR